MLLSLLFNSHIVSSSLVIKKEIKKKKKCSYCITFFWFLHIFCCFYISYSDFCEFSFWFHQFLSNYLICKLCSPRKILCYVVLGVIKKTSIHKINKYEIEFLITHYIVNNYCSNSKKKFSILMGFSI